LISMVDCNLLDLGQINEEQRRSIIEFVRKRRGVARIELAEKYLEEAKDYINKKDAVQASEKMYRVVEECIKALAETLDTLETQEARKNGRWFMWLLGSAARSVANRLGRPEIVETWALAYDVHVRGFHEAKYNVDNVAWGLAYIERLLKITKDVVETSSKK